MKGTNIGQIWSAKFWNIEQCSLETISYLSQPGSNGSDKEGKLHKLYNY